MAVIASFPLVVAIGFLALAVGVPANTAWTLALLAGLALHFLSDALAGDRRGR